MSQQNKIILAVLGIVAGLLVLGAFLGYFPGGFEDLPHTN